MGEVPVLCPVHEPGDVVPGREAIQVGPLALGLVECQTFLADLLAGRVLWSAVAGTFAGIDDLGFEVVVIGRHPGPR